MIPIQLWRLKMKKCLTAVIIILISIMIISCRNNETDTNSTNNPNSNVSPKSSYMENTDKDNEVITVTPEIFTEHSFNTLDSLVGYKTDVEVIDLPDDFEERQKELETLREGVIGSAELWCGENRGINIDIKLFNGKGLTKGYTYIYYLPDELSDCLRIFNAEDWMKITNNGYPTWLDFFEISLPESSRGILIDDEKNILVLFVIDEKSFTIKNAAKFLDIFDLSDYEVFLGFEDESVYKIVLNRKSDNCVYIINAETFELIKKCDMGEWKTIKGYNELIFNNDGEARRGYVLYQINENGNIVRQYDIVNNKTLCSFNLEELPMKGYIKTIYSDGEGRIIVVGDSQGNDILESVIAYDRINDKTYKINSDRYKYGINASSIDKIYFLSTWDEETGDVKKILNLIDEKNNSVDIMPFIDCGNVYIDGKKEALQEKEFSIEWMESEYKIISYDGEENLIEPTKMAKK